MTTTKIVRVTGTAAAPVEHPFAYADAYARERWADGTERLRIGLRDRHATVLRRLVAALRPPYKLLYVLHTSRTGAVLGRYESAVLDRPEVERHLAQFGAFFGGDARHDVWLHSAAGGTLVLDRYNVLYAYGPLADFERVLQAAGVSAGPAPEVPRPYALHYHAEWDTAERDAIRAFGWRVTALRPEDEQFRYPAQAS